MTTPTRIYLVTPCRDARLAPDTMPVLIEAAHPNAALNAVTEGLFTVSLPTSSEVVRLLMRSGAAVIVAEESARTPVATPAPDLPRAEQPAPSPGTMP
ncbi:MAG: hypothetical protein ABL951_16245 [Alphaproteobacteria bacterium]